MRDNYGFFSHILSHIFTIESLTFMTPISQGHLLPQDVWCGFVPAHWVITSPCITA